MAVQALEPRVDLLAEEYVLVQAWKKTSTYIRNHNWYADTLALDVAEVNLRQFLSTISQRLRSSGGWENHPLRLVLAPKSQKWRFNEDGKWAPDDANDPADRLRPLAHVDLADQVLGTAMLMCLADRVETLQGDPPGRQNHSQTPSPVISYGNRLLCDGSEGGAKLSHRWGSQKLYRAYSVDYANFVSRSQLAAETLREGPRQAIVVHSDLRSFYDRVTPELLFSKFTALQQPADDPAFYTLARELMNWQWDTRDSVDVDEYASRAQLTDFTRVGLPQGLVAAGFFANVVLQDFDQALKSCFGTEISEGVRLEDACRYVDDFRIVLSCDTGLTTSTSEIQGLVHSWLQGLIDQHANGLQVSAHKTLAASSEGVGHPLVQQSNKMIRIAQDVSGGFDTVRGLEILDAIQGIIRSQSRYSTQRLAQNNWTLSPVADVRDATVARFAANRFRTTFRSIRPLLLGFDVDFLPDASEQEEEEDGTIDQKTFRSIRTHEDLDADARAFALGLIEGWIQDPSNVRILRVGLDIWPSHMVLSNVLGLLRPLTEGSVISHRKIAWYCLAEVLRAGATETGHVEDEESLPQGVDLAAYRGVLREEALRVLSLPISKSPWYVQQQALLFLAASGVEQIPTITKRRTPETRDYRDLLSFLQGNGSFRADADFATLSILARRCFLDADAASRVVGTRLNRNRLEHIGTRDPSFALELIESQRRFSGALSRRLRRDLCLDRVSDAGWRSLAEVVLDCHPPDEPLRNELSLLRFALKLMGALGTTKVESVSPADILVQLEPGKSEGAMHSVTGVKIEQSGLRSARTSMYQPPSWAVEEDWWRLQLGFILRFILVAQCDFTRIAPARNLREGEHKYKAAQSHWFQRLYGFFNGLSAFGDDWIPISEWTEQLLSELLIWPGCRPSDLDVVRRGFKATRDAIEARIHDLEENQGPVGSAFLLPLKIRRPERSAVDRRLRACVVQTVIPDGDILAKDPEVSSSVNRRQHRRHLSSALEAVKRMLDLRETHDGGDGRLDWLILPELSVHPADVQTHLVPFARQYKTIILAGLTYENLLPGHKLVNSALWIIPEWSQTNGLQVTRRRQGKRYLAKKEAAAATGFRPGQWLVGYPWAEDTRPPLWLTASICYDATDLSLVTDLRDHSDVFAIPAFNKDVNTFDQMALALHYHMFQLVIIANNGEFGGSNAYSPYRKSYERQVFHLHGQPQASIGFIEIDDIAKFLARESDTETYKQPPAGRKPRGSAI